VNIKNLMIYSDEQLYRLLYRLQDLYTKHPNNKDIKVQLQELSREMDARNLDMYNKAEGY